MAMTVARVTDPRKAMVAPATFAARDVRRRRRHPRPLDGGCVLRRSREVAPSSWV